MLISIKSILNIRIFKVSGDSMQPLYASGSYLLVQSAQYLTKSIKRGDIVLLNPSSLGGKVIMKRVIGIPNEQIQIDNGDILIDKEPLEEPYMHKTIHAGTICTGEWMLKSDEYFVLGDNRIASLDSRRLGPIKKDCIQGKVLVRIWPLATQPHP